MVVVGEGVVLLFLWAGFLFPPFFWVLCLLRVPWGKEEGPCAPLCFSTLTVLLPLVSLRAPFASSQSWLYFWSISLEMHGPLSARLQVLGPSSLVCKSDGGRVTAEQGGATETARA